MPSKTKKTLKSTSFFISLLLLVCRIVLAACLYFVIMKVARVELLDECIHFVKSGFKKVTIS